MTLEDQIILNADDKRKLKDMLAEMVQCLSHIDNEREQKKAIAKEAEKQFHIKPALLNKIANTMFKQDFMDKQSENETFEYMYEAIAEGRNIDD